MQVSHASNISLQLCIPCMMQVVDLIQEPIGIALYEMKDGQISNVCIQGGLLIAAFRSNGVPRQACALCCMLAATRNGSW